MKKWLYLAAALTAVGILSRLPHPAKDIAKLKPVRAVYLYMESEKLHIETDTGDSGSGRTLSEAYADMRSGANGEIFLDTAEFLILDPSVPVTEEFCTLLRPACKVVYSERKPDLKAMPDYLAIHPPKTTLAHLRASVAEERSPYEIQTAHAMAPGRHVCAPGPFLRLRLADCCACGLCGIAPDPSSEILGEPGEASGAGSDPLARCRGGGNAVGQRGVLAIGQ